jgi:hypothetical protein
MQNRKGELTRARELGEVVKNGQCALYEAVKKVETIVALFCEFLFNPPDTATVTYGPVCRSAATTIDGGAW